MILFSHPTGNANVRGVLDALLDAGLLSTFVTSIGTFEGNAFGKLSRFGFGKEFARRAYREELAQFTVQAPSTEMARLLANKLKLGSLTRHEKGAFCIDKVYHRMDAFAAREARKRTNEISAVYAYEDGAKSTFEAARSLGKTTLYDLPIGYWRAARRIQSEECKRLPEWATTMPALIDSDEKVARKDEELKLADQIFVASSFTAKTLEEVPFDLPQPLVIPYGCPAPAQSSADLPVPEPTADQVLRVLFVGGLSQRKGLSYLFAAMDELGSRVELTIIGRKPAVTCRPLETALAKYRYIPSLPHEEILAEMRQHDVFVFPSLFEGFGLVVTEALSQGLPVITTPHTCGPDILTEGEDGFIVPIRDSTAIAEKLALLHGDRDRLMAMKKAALATARRWTWKRYRDGMVAAIKPHLQ